jgi:hypothetical protein
MEKVFWYLSHMENARNYYEGFFQGRVPLFNGEITLSSLWGYVPRLLYPEKPYVYGVTHINEIFFPGMAALGHTPAFDGGVEYFADFGFFGFPFLAAFDTHSLVKWLALGAWVRMSGFPSIAGRKPVYVVSICVLIGPAFGAFLQPGYLAIFCFAIYVIVRKETAPIGRVTSQRH